MSIQTQPMTAKQRFLTALAGGQPDRLPVTTHHVMDYFLKTYLNGASTQAFFDQFGIDPIHWVVAHKSDPAKGQWENPDQQELGFLEARLVFSDTWRIESEEVPGQDRPTRRYRIITPKKTLSCVLQSNQHTAWVVEHLVKEKEDIEIIDEFMSEPVCDVEEVNRQAEVFGERGLIRGHIPCFDIFGQPGCWQDAACLFGIEPLIMATYTDPEWVHQFLRVMQRRKLSYIRSLKGARYDLLELGGGDASSTVISPGHFEQFVAPYDAPLIAAAHEAGQRIVYHTCGGMMPILELVAAMQPDAMETFTPADMGGDANLAEAKRRIGDKVCMIGGFDQFHFFKNCTPERTRAEVRRCFEAAGAGGGYILSPSDHFFDADPELIGAFADEARRCVY